MCNSLKKKLSPPKNVNVRKNSTTPVVAMSSSQCVNRGRACIVVNRDNYSEYYMCVQWPSTFFAKSLFFAHFKVLLIIALLNNYAHLMYLCNKCCLETYYL